MSGALVFRPHWHRTAEQLVAELDAIIVAYHDNKATLTNARESAIALIRELGFSEADAIRYLERPSRRSKPKAAPPQGSPVGAIAASPPLPPPGRGLPSPPSPFSPLSPWFRILRSICDEKTCDHGGEMFVNHAPRFTYRDPMKGTDAPSIAPTHWPRVISAKLS